MRAKILVFVPAYNCAAQIDRVLDQLERPWVRRFVDQAIVVDNRSTDATASVVRTRIARRGDRFISLLRNHDNYGLGGSHKVAFDYARETGFDWVIVLHGDDQGDIDDLRPHLESGDYAGLDALLGSRFMSGSRLANYSRLRRVGNAVFNGLYSACLRFGVRDLGAGLNMYRVSALARTNYHLGPDNLTFNCVLLASQIITGCRIGFFPISWREDGQASNVKLLRQSLQTLRIAGEALLGRRGFISTDRRVQARRHYSWTLVDARAA